MQLEIGAGKNKCGSLDRLYVQWIFSPEIWKSFSVNESLFRRERGSLQLVLFLPDPILMVLDEFLDGCLGHPQGSADRHAAVPLDDECYRFSTGMDQVINGDWHGREYINIYNEPSDLLAEGYLPAP